MAEDRISHRVKQALLYVLGASMVAGVLLGPMITEPGFLPFFIALALGSSFYGRQFGGFAALAVFIAHLGMPLHALALAGTVFVLGERTDLMRRRLGRFAHRSFTDRLTGLYNFDFLQAQVRYEVDRVRRYGNACSLIVFDLDHFKRFNDTHGHQAGNLLLRAMSDCIRREKRDSDHAARFGGEEFVVLMPGDEQDAMRLAERIRVAVSEIELPHLGPTGRVTVSAGIASFPAQGTNAAELFERADQALYVAKSDGRNCVIMYPNIRVQSPDSEPRQAPIENARRRVPMNVSQTVIPLDGNSPNPRR